MDGRAEFLDEKPGERNKDGPKGNGELVSGENCSSDALAGDASKESNSGDTKALDISVDSKSDEIHRARAGYSKNRDCYTNDEVKGCECANCIGLKEFVDNDISWYWNKKGEGLKLHVEDGGGGGGERNVVEVKKEGPADESGSNSAQKAE